MSPVTEDAKLMWRKIAAGEYETVERYPGHDVPLFRVRRSSAPSGYFNAWKLFGWDGLAFRCLDRPSSLTEAKGIAAHRIARQEVAR